MSHAISSMAYVGAAPWHRLGSRLAPQQPLEVWARDAGMDWSIRETPVRYLTEAGGSPRAFDQQKVLYRSDTGQALSVVGGRYQVVQPRTVLEFYRDLTEISGFALETAGVLKEGRKFWALARTGKETRIQGQDLVRGYILLATSCDGSLATTATPTTVRVVCANTLAVALNGAVAAVRVPHNTQFNAQEVKSKLGIAVSGWDDFMYRMQHLAQRRVNEAEAQRFLGKVFAPAPVGAGSSRPVAAPLQGDRARRQVQALFQGHGHGATLSSAQGTAWGLLNAVTEFVDHARRARSAEYRLDSAWFGQGAEIKQRALEAACALV